MGRVHQALGGQANLKQALELYQKGLDFSEALARQLNTVSAYDDLAVSYYKMGSCLPEGYVERRRYLVKFMELSEQLFRQTHNERYRKFVEQAHQLLSQAQQAAQPADHPVKASLWSKLFGRGK